MNANEQAQKGFKTFILTLSISLIVFSVIYYLISNNSNFEQNSDLVGDASNAQPAVNAEAAEVVQPEAPAEIVEAPTEPQVDETVAVVEEEVTEALVAEAESEVAGIATEASVFEQLASQTGTTRQTGAVLAGASESSQSTVPVTGVTSVTFGLIASLVIFFGVMLFMSKDPRRFAMSGFEKKMTR